MAFPRIKQFDFTFGDSYVVPENFAGRLDLIANAIYGDYRYYKVLVAANSITCPMAFRFGVRPIREAITSESNGDASIYSTLMDEHRTTDNDWTDYGSSYSGYVSEVNPGRLLIVPNADSATRYMNQFTYITKGI